MRVAPALTALVALLASGSAQAQFFPLTLDVDVCPGQPAVQGSLGTHCDPTVAPGAEEWVLNVEATGEIDVCLVDPAGYAGQVFDHATYGSTWTKVGNSITLDFTGVFGVYLGGFLTGGTTCGGVMLDPAGLATPRASQLASWDGAGVPKLTWDDCVNGVVQPPAWIEDFETGVLEPYWIIDDYSYYGAPVAPWFVQSYTVYDGAFSAESGDINNAETTTISVVVDFPSSGGVGFWHTGDTEPNFDFLRFYIDGIQRQAWSGSWGWTRSAYSLGSGTHTLTWSYMKDYSVSVGADTVWLDDIEVDGVLIP